jgi:hypothetical protein
MWQQAFSRPSTAAIDSAQNLAHAVTALRQDPVACNTTKMLKEPRGGDPFPDLLSLFLSFCPSLPFSYL